MAYRGSRGGFADGQQIQRFNTSIPPPPFAVPGMFPPPFLPDFTTPGQTNSNRSTQGLTDMQSSHSGIPHQLPPESDFYHRTNPPPMPPPHRPVFTRPTPPVRLPITAKLSSFSQSKPDEPMSRFALPSKVESTQQKITTFLKRTKCLSHSSKVRRLKVKVSVSIV